MKKLLFILSLILFLAFPVAQILATTQIYVGVQVTNASAPGCVSTGASNECGVSGIDYSTYPNYTPDSNWCLPTGTQMAIMTGTASSCTYATSNYYDASSVCQYCGSPNNCLADASSSVKYVTTVKPTCASGNTIWSGLVTVSNGSAYNVYLHTPNFCPGYVSGNYCIVSAPSLPSAGTAPANQQDCCSICAYYGLTAYGLNAGTDCPTSNCVSASAISGGTFSDENCKIEEALMGEPCSTCNTGVSMSNYSTTTPRVCNTTYLGNASYVSCSAAAAGYDRVCACNVSQAPTSFLFPFTASW